MLHSKHSTPVYGLKLSVLRGVGTKALATDHRYYQLWLVRTAHIFRSGLPSCSFLQRDPAGHKISFSGCEKKNKSLLSLKKMKIECTFSFVICQFSKTWQLNTGFHFSLFISHFFNFAKQWIYIKFNLIPHLPAPKWKLNMQFHFQKKRMNRTQVRWLALNNDYLFHSVDVIQFNSRTRGD